MRRMFHLLLLTCISTFLCAENNDEAHRPEHLALNPEFSSVNEQTQDPLSTLLPNFAPPQRSASEEDSEHGPLGSACADLVSYYTYFAQNFMTDAPQQHLRNNVYLFCNTMTLMSDLADKNFRHVRIDTYANDIIGIIRTIKTIMKSDGTVDSLRTQSPALYSIIAPQEFHAYQGDEEVEVGVSVHHALRTRKAATPLISDLFEQLSKYTKTQLHSILALFKNDTQKLLNMVATRAPGDSGTQANSAQSRIMKQQAWMCRAAANACQEFELALPQDTFLEHSHELMKIIRSLLDAMALTYNRLSKKSSAVRQGDRSLLANHFAQIIHLLPQQNAEPSRAPFRSGFFIPRCQQLATLQDQEQFIEEAFEKNADREALLQELFPVLTHDLEESITHLTQSLKQYTLQTLNERYWLT